MNIDGVPLKIKFYLYNLGHSVPPCLQSEKQLGSDTDLRFSLQETCKNAWWCPQHPSVS
eukprot:m.227438 g.227438  ORF g.227438 m.227438 type:complete len:59 (+) comp15973_c0_seq1:5080-5256(+)